jgi:2-dehydropantoate 2-reductase
MGKRIVVVGAGAIGGYAGGHMTRAGHDVTLIDPWPEHVEYMRSHGLQLSGLTEGERHSIPVNALHLCEVQGLMKGRPVDIAFICVKSYDTEWATHLIRPYLAPDGFVVSLQNCINEERIAAIVGWGKTLGCIASLVAAELYQPGHIKRTVPIGGDKHIVFRVGEVHGRVSKRAEEVAELVRAADSAKVTTNLWGERWSKLVVNSMRNGLSAATGSNGCSAWSRRNWHAPARAAKMPSRKSSTSCWKPRKSAPMSSAHRWRRISRRGAEPRPISSMVTLRPKGWRSACRR